MRLMNRIFGDLAGRKLIYYVDDILLFSATYEEHLQLIDTVLSRLATNLLCVKLPTCVFAVQTLEFCGMVVSTKGIHLDQSHLDAMWDYPQITSATDISKFMGSVRFFADFIPWLADIASPLFDLTKAHAPFTWTTDHQTIVRVIQYYLSHAPVLRYFDPTLPTHVHTDASKFAIGGWLGQIHPDGKEYVVSYWSRRMIPAELNYPVHEQEFLALHDFVMKFRMYLHGIAFTAHVDHRAMEHLQTQPHLSPRQIRWIEHLQEYQPIIQYVKGELNTFADWLSRRPDYARIICPRCDTVVKSLDSSESRSTRISVIKCSEFGLSDTLLDDIRIRQQGDPFCQKLQSWVDDPATIPQNLRGFSKSFSTDSSGLWLYRKGSVVVPDGPQRTTLLEHFHNRVDHGHFGFKKTHDAITHYFYWDTLISDLRSFISSCITCERNKQTDSRRHGLLHPLPVPDDRFLGISVDFGDMPVSRNGHDSCLIIQDRFSKLIEVIPTTKTVSALQVAELIFLHWYLRGYGLPQSMVSDRDPRFVSAVWREFCSLTGITQITSVSRHQQTNGGAESMIKMFKSAVRRLTSYDGTDWPSLCPQIQFAYNNSLHTTTGFRPYYLAFGFLPVTFPLFSVRPSLPLATAFDNYHKHIELAHQLISSSTSGASHRYNNAHSSPPTYSVGDKVWLDREGITGPADSNIRLSFRQPFLGPFSILAVDTVLDNITLDLPATMRVHNVFHVSSIKPWRDPSSHFPARTVPTEPPPEIIADQRNLRLRRFSITRPPTMGHGSNF
jgi:hypothetical protein